MDKQNQEHEHTASNALRVIAGLLVAGALVLAACSGSAKLVEKAVEPALADIVMAVNPAADAAWCVSGSSFGFTDGHNYVEFRPNFCYQSWNDEVSGPYPADLWYWPDAAHGYVAQAGLSWPGNGEIPISDGGRLFGLWLPSDFSICTK